MSDDDLAMLAVSAGLSILAISMCLGAYLFQDANGILFGVIVLLLGVFMPHLVAVTMGSKRHRIFAVAMLALAVISLGISSYYACTGNVESVDVQSVFYSLYTVDAPFGILWRETTGSASIFIVFGTARLDTSLQETYNVKYFTDENNIQMQTLQLKATDTTVMGDGKFSLEYRVTVTSVINPVYGNLTNSAERRVEYIIHIPKFPDVGSGITEEYKVVNG